MAIDTHRDVNSAQEIQFSFEFDRSSLAASRRDEEIASGGETGLAREMAIREPISLIRESVKLAS